MDVVASTLPNRCPRCAAAFACGMRTGQANCWCASLPPALVVPPAEDSLQGEACYCPDCLATLIEARSVAADP